MATEFEIGGKKYRAEKLSAKLQFHLSRKISPILPPLLPLVVARIDASKSGGKEFDMGKFATLLQPFADGLAAMPNEAADFVLDTCLGAVKRETDANAWVPIWNSSAQMAMFADLDDMGALLPIVMRVIQGSLGPFISEFLMKRSPDQPAA